MDNFYASQISMLKPQNFSNSSVFLFQQSLLRKADLQPPPMLPGEILHILHSTKPAPGASIPCCSHAPRPRKGWKVSATWLQPSKTTYRLKPVKLTLIPSLFLCWMVTIWP